MPRKLICIGLDGATFNFIDPLLGQGALPNIAKIISNGGAHILESTIPPTTVPAWPAFMTGMNPGKLGVFDFFLFDEKKAEHRIVNRTDIKAYAVWDILSNIGVKCLIQNVPCTYPPLKINGAIISGMLTPQDGKFVEPEEFKSLIENHLGRKYRINEDWKYSSKPNSKKFLTDIFEVTDIHTETFLFLNQKFDFDFSVILFRATDIVCHYLWNRTHKILTVYKYIDGKIGEIVKQFPEANFIIISDHGFTSRTRTFFVNNWLMQNGYLSIRKGTTTEKFRAKKKALLEGRKATQSILTTKILLHKLGLNYNTLRKFIPARILKIAGYFVPQRIKQLMSNLSIDFEVDWSKTTAYVLSLFGSETRAIAVNRDLISSQEYDNFVQSLIEKLESIVDDKGNKVVKKAYRREQVYSGPYLNDAPDII